MSHSSSSPDLRHIPVDQCYPSPLNTRRNGDQGDKFDQLVASINDAGILQPVLARENPDSDGHPFEIIAGSRRLAAAKKLQLPTIPAHLRPWSKHDDDSATAAMIIENIIRKDFDPIEEAEGFLQLRRLCGYTQELIADRCKVSSLTIKNRLALLDLPEEDQAAVRSKTLTLRPAEKRATCYRWIQKSLKQIEQHPDGQIIAAYLPKDSAHFFDDLTDEVHWDQPYLDLSQAPSDGELARHLSPSERRRTWGDLIAGFEGGDTIKIIRAISPGWRKVELAESGPVIEFIRANNPHHLRKQPTSLANAEREQRQQKQRVWDLTAAHCQQAIETHGLRQFDQSIIRAALVNTCTRLDLEAFAERLRCTDYPGLEDHELRKIVLDGTADLDAPTLLLSTLLLIAARRDNIVMPDHPAAQPLLDELGLKPNTITKDISQRVADSVKPKTKKR